MLLGHLLCGLVAGWLAALASFLAGLSFEAMLGVYAVSAYAAIGLSMLTTSTAAIRLIAGLRYATEHTSAVGSAHAAVQERPSEDLGSTRQPGYPRRRARLNGRGGAERPMQPSAAQSRARGFCWSCIGSSRPSFFWPWTPGERARSASAQVPGTRAESATPMSDPCQDQ